MRNNYYVCFFECPVGADSRTSTAIGADSRTSTAIGADSRTSTAIGDWCTRPTASATPASACPGASRVVCAAQCDGAAAPH